MTEQPLPGAMPPLPDDMPPPPLPEDMPLPINAPSHADTKKFAEKTGPFDPAGDRTETQLKLWRYVHTTALRSTKMAEVRGCGRAGFDLSTFKDIEMKELQEHLATILLISTRGGTSDLLMSAEDQQDGRALFLILMDLFLFFLIDHLLRGAITP